MEWLYYNLFGSGVSLCELVTQQGSIQSCHLQKLENFFFSFLKIRAQIVLMINSENFIRFFKKGAKFLGRELIV